MLKRCSAPAAPEPPVASRQIIPSTFFFLLDQLGDLVERASRVALVIQDSWSASARGNSSARPHPATRFVDVMLSRNRNDHDVPFTRMSAAIRFRLSRPALTLSVPTYTKRFESGPSASTQITGMPAAPPCRCPLENLGPRRRRGQIPQGSVHDLAENSYLPCGSYVVGPVSSPFTPAFWPTSRNPASVSFQYGKLIFVATTRSVPFPRGRASRTTHHAAPTKIK